SAPGARPTRRIPMKMAWPTILCGIALGAMGAWSYGNALPDPITGQVSKTALIPAAVGAVLVVLGVLGGYDATRKHAMHAVAVVALLGVVGGFFPLVSRMQKGRAFGDVIQDLAAKSGLAMSGICLILLILCVISFVQARKGRGASEPAGASA